MNTDDLRSMYGKSVHFNCKDGDEAFTDEYVLWLEKQLLLHNTVEALRTHDVVKQSEKLKCPDCGSFNRRVYNLKTLRCEDCGSKWAF